MPIQKSAKIQKRGAKRMDLSAMREALADGKMWTCLGIVKAEDANDDYYELDGTDLMVEVELQPSEIQVTARMGVPGGTNGAGIWHIPPLGSEVLVLIPEGDLSFHPCIVAQLSSGAVPDDITPTRIVIAAPEGGEVYIHDGSGSVDRLVKKSEYDALKSSIDAHTHTVPITGPAGTTASTPPLAPAPSATGTTVLKAK